MPDSTRVKLYRQLGASPDPNNDDYLGVDATIDADGSWSIPAIDVSGWSTGHHKIYACAMDNAGNWSVAGTVKEIIVGGLRGLLLDDWADNKLTLRNNFEVTAFDAGEPLDSGDGVFVSSRPDWITITGSNYSVSGGEFILGLSSYVHLHKASVSQNRYGHSYITYEYRFRRTYTQTKTFALHFMHSYDTVPDNCYQLNFDVGSGTIKLVKKIDGVVTALITTTVPLDLDYHTIKVRVCISGAMYLYWDNVEIGSCSDTSLTSGSYVSFRLTAAYAGTVYIDWLKVYPE